MIKYPIIEIFTSVQGEGTHMGKGADFIRLAGCNLRCAWCDTKHSFDTAIASYLTAEEIINGNAFTQPMTVITGGEPTLHDLSELVAALKACGKYVALETNGTRQVPAEWEIDWVTVSPKPDSAYSVNCRADELKYVVDEVFAIANIAQGLVPSDRIYLQIEGAAQYSRNKALAIVLNNPQLKLRIGLQMHKALAIE